jgi:glycosyltransferase involved in cell wall biosynthesis
MTRRILFFSDSHSQCGVGINTAAVMTECVRRGYTIACAQRRENTELQRRLAALGVTYHWFPRSPDDDLAAFINDRATPEEIFRAARPDLIFFANGVPAGSHGAIQAALKLGIPYVIDEGLVVDQFLGGNDAERAALRRNYLAAQTVITKSRENLDRIHRRFDLPAGFGRVVANGAAAEFFAPRDATARRLRRRMIGLAEEDILCFTAAGLRPVKGYSHQIQALRHLEHHALFDHIKFAWAGDGPMRAFLAEQIAKFGFDHHIFMLGHIADIADWLDAADIFVLPSLGEGMPGCVLEAMAKGVPVIATPAGGTPEALGDCGTLLADIADDNARARALADAIAYWAGDAEARAEAGERCRARARARFTRERMLDDYLTAIGEVFRAIG